MTVPAVALAEPDPVRRFKILNGIILGFYLMVQLNGAKCFALHYRYGGEPRNLTLCGFPGIELAAARNLVSDLLP